MFWQHTVPKPCTVEDLDKIQTWLDSKEVLSKEEVMLETFGYTDERSANQAVKLPRSCLYWLSCCLLSSEYA